MDLKTYTTGIQHIGIPTNDIEKTIAFYQKLGFEIALQTVNEEADEKVAFLFHKIYFHKILLNQLSSQIQAQMHSYYLKVVRQRQKVFLTTAGIYFESFRQLF